MVQYIRPKRNVTLAIFFSKVDSNTVVPLLSYHTPSLAIFVIISKIANAGYCNVALGWYVP